MCVLLALVQYGYCSLKPFVGMSWCASYWSLLCIVVLQWIRSGLDPGLDPGMDPGLDPGLDPKWTGSWNGSVDC